MSANEPARVRSGTPDGGQFAAQARTEPDVTLTPEAAGSRIESATQAVVDALGVGTAVDDGGGSFIAFDYRHELAGDRDAAYYLDPDEASDPAQGGKWIFHRGDSGEELSNGFYTDDATSDLTLDSDPAEVADWIKSQMHHFGTPGAPA